MHQSRGPVAVIHVLIPLVAEQPLHQHRRLPAAQRRDRRVSPEAQRRVPRRHLQRVIPPSVHSENGASELILWLRPERIERPAITPRARPLVRHRVELLDVLRLL
eukprot:6071110-Prymnesium_polylepis.1